MILVFGAYPTLENEQDGMIQRIKAIDELMNHQKRVYLSISFKKNFHIQKTEINHLTTEYHINIIKHLFLLFYLIYQSNLIYVHSIHNSLKVPFIYYLPKPVLTDVHGAVPEELALLNSRLKYIIFSKLEKLMYKRSKYIICVSQAMKTHLEEKYGKTHANFIILPIFSTNNSTPSFMEKTPNSIIYAGGTQQWQNINQMIDFINHNECFNYYFLTKNIDEVRNKLNPTSNIVLISTSVSEAQNYLKKSIYGFLLRRDDTINRVACPTKLIEYLDNNVVPIILQPNIGDFNLYGFSYFLLSELEHNNINNNKFIEEKLTNNRRVLKELILNTKNAKAQLQAILDKQHHIFHES